MSVRIRMFQRRTPPYRGLTDSQFLFQLDHMELGSKHPTRENMVCVEHEMKTHSKSHYVLTATYKLRPGLKFIEGYMIIPEGTSVVSFKAKLVPKEAQV